MDLENYMEIYEAVYFFNKIHCNLDKKLQLTYNVDSQKTKLCKCIYIAMLRILVSNDLLQHTGNCFILTKENVGKHRYILENIIKADLNKQNKCESLFQKAMNKSYYFFDNISEIEYEIYSRSDFSITFKLGQEITRHINLADKKVLELGGNSGGLGSALLKKYLNCQYTIVDTKIPCKVGKEYRDRNNLNIMFKEGDIFDLKLRNKYFDYIILMNILHDFDDIKCLNILYQCQKYIKRNTKYLIIEDVLTEEFEPKEAILHGLRLSVECNGGKQRTIDEYVSLFSNINFELDKKIGIDRVHTMLLMKAL